MHTGKCRGFTMVEMLVVISIIAILAGLLGSGLMSARKSSQNEATRAIMTRLTVALNTYKGDFKTYPLYFPSSTATHGGRQFPVNVVFNPPSGTPYKAGGTHRNNGQGNNRILGMLWGIRHTADSAMKTPYHTKAEYDSVKSGNTISAPTYLRDANLEPDGAVDNNIVDLWGQPILYVYMVGYPVTSTQPLNAGTTLTRWNAQQLGDASHGRDKIKTSGGDAPFGRPDGSAPLPWRNDLELYPFATEFELWSAGPDRMIDNTPKSNDLSGTDRLHNLQQKENRDNISGAQWKMD